MQKCERCASPATIHITEVLGEGKFEEHHVCESCYPKYFQNGEAHGVGIVQIDIQHKVARDARDSVGWKTDPEPLIAFGGKLLADNIARARAAFGNLGETQSLKIAASGYNCGLGSAINGARHGDSDKFTTHGDYGRDVMTRMAMFDELIEVDPKFATESGQS